MKGDKDMGVAAETVSLPDFTTQGVKPSKRERKLLRQERKKTEKSAKLAALECVRHPKDYSQIEHRLKHEQYSIGGGQRGGVSITKIEEPLRIDKLLAKGTIDESQHIYGLQIITLWTVANKPFMGSMNYSEQRRPHEVEKGVVSKMTAEDQFYKTMMYLAAPHMDYLQEMRRQLLKPALRKEKRGLLKQIEHIEAIQKRSHERSHDLICLICFEEKSAYEATDGLKIGRDDSTDYIKKAFDALGEALVKMRVIRKKVEDLEEKVQEPS